MQDLADGQVGATITANDIRVKPDDKISIIVKSRDPLLSEMFNLSIASHRVGSGPEVTTSTGNQFVSFYTVNPDGDIDFPTLGKIHIAGMRRNEVTDYIKNRLVKEDLVKDPVVTMEYVNTGVNIMG